MWEQRSGSGELLVPLHGGILNNGVKHGLCCWGLMVTLFLLLCPDSLRRAGHHRALYGWSHWCPHRHNRVWTTTARPLQVSLALHVPPACRSVAAWCHVPADTWASLIKGSNKLQLSKAKDVFFSPETERFLEAAISCQAFSTWGWQGWHCTSSGLVFFAAKPPCYNTCHGVMSYFL